ncbi:TetR/AcrR family transcriptional regulator [Vagococcus sp. PNs007]|uniref:TetR/AcrR family transcriptional regulator n=1 Tax=Vagococcus proximus TaxID=2991417 RepID=A0ABT5WYZ0_9ENTE|nr:TetR/AcrR family transcriptional regulator [Vagococcus proximus]MDF0478849.1 TetR/AcrR family transcriptional regulator [Vagococcus proximus]
MNLSKVEERKKYILRSASELLAEKGLTDITIDEVAKQACLSKGGVTHYFKNKDQLLVELANMLDEDYLDRIENEAAKHEEAKGVWTRALLGVADLDLLGETEITNALVAGAMASQKEGNDAKSFEVIQSKLVSDGYDPVLATIIRLAIDGLYYAELFKAEPLDPKLRKDVFDRMISWTE